ncbi:MAG: PQQ-dependent sugar dehydrogenase [Pseudomonadota bacterium]|nr:hypothetical protein [Gammaproteobacteria bacterium]MEC8012532.1 PQQ-dependent sugar dehydrogenase [Pseudomonadota bacterium]HBF08122.1 hypothetical protein [Gammaproteobacteria bacterium]|tara:strand:+ start:18652 stop:19818 length:1167 start_codon:yes stop_codon:yes gene_type:complete
MLCRRFIISIIFSSLIVGCKGNAEPLKPLVQLKTLSTDIKTNNYPLMLESVVTGLEHPWGLAFIDENRVLVTERTGQLYLIDIEDQELKTVAGLPEVYAQGQGGLLDIALHPDFKKNRIIYFSYAATHDGKSGTQLATAKLKKNKSKQYALDELQVLFQANPFISSSHHFGGRIALNDQYIYLSLGDHGQRNWAQDTENTWGSIVRLKLNGEVPEGNIKVNNDTSLIYSYGHRNPQGLVYANKTLYEHEHGPQGGDELNIIRKGINYGWPLQTYGKEYVTGFNIGDESLPGVEAPLYQWTPSIAPSGLEYYTGKEFPNWQGQLFVGALKFKKIVRLEIKDKNIINKEDFLQDEVGRIRAIKQSPKKGYLYILTDESKGQLVRIRRNEM